MARLRVLDKLQSFRFWLSDFSPDLRFARDAIPFLVFNPTLGFSSITAPRLTAKVEDIEQAGALTKTPVITGHDVGRITASRGTTIYESDLERWFARAQHGRGAPRRTLLLIQFSEIGGSINSVQGAIGTAGLAALGTAASLSTGNFTGLGALAATSASMIALGGGTVRLPAKAWILRGCVPTLFVPATDFDAKSSEISIEQIEIAPKAVDPISLG